MMKSVICYFKINLTANHCLNIFEGSQAQTIIYPGSREVFKIAASSRLCIREKRGFGE